MIAQIRLIGLAGACNAPMPLEVPNSIVAQVVPGTQVTCNTHSVDSFLVRHVVQNAPAPKLGTAGHQYPHACINCHDALYAFCTTLVLDSIGNCHGSMVQPALER